MRPIPLVLLAVLGFAPLAGCGDDPKWNAVKKEAGETWDALKAYGVAQRAKAETGFTEGLTSLEKTWAETKKAAAAKGEVAGQALDARWKELNDKLATLKAAGADKWTEARDEFVKAYENLKKDVAPAK